MANRILRPSKRRLNPILSLKDRQILDFLWKHRIATFQALRQIFYPELTNEQTYYQLRRLKLGEFIKAEKMDGTKDYVWCLELRGYKYLVANRLPEVKVRTFRPQRHYHDLLAASALLGKWATRRPESVMLISEQEMSALDLPEIPFELRKEREHQPDGLWLFKNGVEPKAVALEVEISAKTNARYEQICAFYSSHLFFQNVVWIVEGKTLGRRILETSRLHGIPREGLHLFISQEDFEIEGWDAHFLNESMRTSSLADYLGAMAASPGNHSAQRGLMLDSCSAQPGLKNTSPNPFLDFSFSLTKLATLKQARLPKIP